MYICDDFHSGFDIYGEYGDDDEEEEEDGRVAAAIKSDIFENMRGALKYVKRREKRRK